MSNKLTGGPAFPTGTGWDHNSDWAGGGDDGMTLRDYFAAKAMQSLITIQLQTKQVATAETAYEWADAMLKARNTNE